mmetsp:Transcript_23815/g.31586  ORF Transcript_23815/g.31586 Transcript_23815/m.31586 type:complete len:91 (+) Transcript_23815:2118-2390(+)
MMNRPFISPFNLQRVPGKLKAIQHFFVEALLLLRKCQKLHFFNSSLLSGNRSVNISASQEPQPSNSSPNQNPQRCHLFLLPRQSVPPPKC